MDDTLACSDNTFAELTKKTREKCNSADGMTKLRNCELVIHLSRTGKANFEVKQWVLRLEKETIQEMNFNRMVIAINSVIPSKMQLQKNI